MGVPQHTVDSGMFALMFVGVGETELINEKGILGAIRAAYESTSKIGVQGPRVVLPGKGAGLTIEMWFNKVTRTIETAYPKTVP